MGCTSLLFGGEFSETDIAATRAARGLLSMEVEVGTACNFRCRYCYVGDDTAQMPGDRHELTERELRDVIGQAQALGARKIILLGGEPMLYDFTLDLCDWIRGRGMAVEMFTNGTNMTAAAARRLFDLQVHVVLKWHSADRHLQNWLAGVSGAVTIMECAMENLRAAGYPSEKARMALSTVICRQNIAELPEMWRWIRNAGIEPYFEMITPQGRARHDESALSPTLEETMRLFETIREIDRAEYGRVWESQPPLLGNRCLRHSFSCFVNASGDVMPCVGVAIAVGNIRRRPLAEILADSEVIADLRNHVQTIQGACARCDKAAGCYGCRGAAFQLTQNYLASDPMCWRNQGGANISALPIPATRLVPHRPPMLMVDELTAVGERCATVAATVRPDNPFCRDGVLAAAAHLEIMAQASAALQGFRTQLRHDSVALRGMLVGTRDFAIFSPLRNGDKVTVTLHKKAKLGPIGIVEASITSGGKTVATAELKIWEEP